LFAFLGAYYYASPATAVSLFIALSIRFELTVRGTTLVTPAPLFPTTITLFPVIPNTVSTDTLADSLECPWFFQTRTKDRHFSANVILGAL
jgi:hypothetical protein